MHRPIDARLLGFDALAVHAAQPVEHFACAYQHFLRIAPAQLAGAAERAGIDDGHGPSRGAALPGYGTRRRARADHYQVEGFVHALSDSA